MQDPRTNRMAELRLKYRGRYDAAAMFVYVGIVYALSLTVYPLGRDYALLAHPSGDMGVLAGLVFRVEMLLFGKWLPGYHLANMLCIYGCMVCIYRIVSITMKGPFWLGTLAATLFMANPTTGEAVLRLSGVEYLLPCLLALAALALYASHARQPAYWKYFLAWVLTAVASLSSQSCTFLFVVIALYEWLVVPRDKRRQPRLILFALVGAAAIVAHGTALRAGGLALAQRFTPLYFLFYPLGFLPETAKTFHDSPWLGWLAALATLGMVALAYRKARRRTILFGLLAMFALRLSGGVQPVDPVHLVGGGQLLLPSALYHVAFVALCLRIMENVRWRLTMISATTILCVIYFGMQINRDLGWRRASHLVQSFQQDAMEQAEPVLVCPDYQFLDGAPLCLSNAIAFDTLFSNAIVHRSAVRMQYFPRTEMQVAFEPEPWPGDGGEIVIRGKKPIEVACWPYAWPTRSAPERQRGAAVELAEETENGFRLHVRLDPPITPPYAILPGGQRNPSE